MDSKASKGFGKGPVFADIANAFPTSGTPDSVVSFTAAGRKSALNPFGKKLGGSAAFAELTAVIHKRGYLDDNIDDVAPEVQGSEESDSS